MVIDMKQMNLKSKNGHKRIKYLFVTALFILSTYLTFNYLNNHIYDYNTKEYIDLFTRVSFSFDNNIEVFVNKMFDLYDHFTNTEVVKR